MIDRLLTTPCTIHNVTGNTTDAEGNTTPTYSDHPTRCHRQPVRHGVGEGEDVSGATVGERRWRIWLPADVPITVDSIVTVAGVACAVWGDPETRTSPDGRHKHTAAIIRQAI